MPTKETTYKEEVIKMPEFQSSTPVFGQSTNPIDLNMAVMNRFTGQEGVYQFNNLTGGNNQQDVVFEIPFDIKTLQCYTLFYNSLSLTSSNGAIRGICNGSSVKPFSGTIQTFNDGQLYGNFNGIYHSLQYITNAVKDLVVSKESIDNITTDLTQIGDNPVEDLSFFYRTPSTGELLTGVSYTPFTFPIRSPFHFVSQGDGCAGDGYYPNKTDYNFRIYPLIREDKRVTVRCDIKDGRKAFCVFTFL